MRTGRNTKRQHNYYVKIRFLLNWQWVLSDILGENSIKKRRSNSFQKAFERRLCFDRMAGVTGIFERISFLLQKSLFVFHDHRISFCGIYTGCSVTGSIISTITLSSQIWSPFCSVHSNATPGPFISDIPKQLYAFTPNNCSIRRRCSSE